MGQNLKQLTHFLQFRFTVLANMLEVFFLLIYFVYFYTIFFSQNIISILFHCFSSIHAAILKLNIALGATFCLIKDFCAQRFMF